MEPKELEAQARAALKERNDAVIQLFAKHTQLGELKSQILADPEITVEKAKDMLLDELGKDTKPHGGVQVIEDAIEKASKGMAKSLLVRGQLGEKDDEANEFRGFTLLEMAREHLRLRGAAVPGDKMQLVAQAFMGAGHGTSDFGNILSNTANKSMLKGFMEADEVFDQFTGVGNLPDFKVNERVDIGHMPSLKQVREGAEYKYVTLGDKGVTAQLATYGNLFSITRQAIINDDLNAFTRIPMKFGRAARRTVGDLVFNAVINNTYSAAAGGNAITGSALNSENWNALRTKMRKQKDGDIVTPVRPAYCLVPLALESTALQVQQAEFMVDGSAKDSQQPNTARNTAQVFADHRLDENSATTYYGLADPNGYDALDVLYLDGNPNPMLEQQTSWNVDGAEFKVRLDAAAKLWDKRSCGRGAA